MSDPIPRIESLPNGASQLLVGGKPYLMRGGELHNSSLSSPSYMDDVWQKLVDSHINTVLGSVSWEQIEPAEGQFDFRILDGMIRKARQHGLRLVLLWFGAHKNGTASYVPSWVKTNNKRFPRVEFFDRPGQPPKLVEVLSVFAQETLKADIEAFRTLMSHLRDIDSENHTVIMVQVENEVGLLGDSRDRAELAEKAWRSNVPRPFIEALRDRWDSLSSTIRPTLDFFAKGNEGTWEETFGTGVWTDEKFMAYHYAAYVEQVAAAGREAYPLPLYTNVALSDEAEGDSPLFSPASGGHLPGIYPSGGPVHTVLDIWHIMAPTIEFYAPDIYFPDYNTTCERYTHRGLPLFIPEQRRDEHGALRIWSAVGNYHALGVAPFGIDSELPGPITRHYELLKKVEGHILAARKDGRKVYGFWFDRFSPGDKDPSAGKKSVTFGAWQLSIARAFVFGHPEPGYGVIIHLNDEDDFLLIGEGYQVQFISTHPAAAFSGIRDFEEVDIDAEGYLVGGRLLNGDETVNGKYARMPTGTPDFGGFPIPVTIPSKTKVARCRPYFLQRQ